MFLAVETVEAAYRFLDLRYHFGGSLNLAGIVRALDEAEDLALDRDDQPAALFYALAIRPKALGGAWRTLPALIAINLPIVTRSMTYQDVRTWFAARR